MKGQRQAQEEEEEEENEGEDEEAEEVMRSGGKVMAVKRLTCQCFCSPALGTYVWPSSMLSA